jgi:hypothetical protein
MPLISTRRTIRTQRHVAVALTAGLALLLAACSSSTKPSAGAQPSASLGAATATATATATAPSDETPSSPAATHAYPKDYAKAILTAWADKDAAYLALLTSSDDQRKLYATGSPNQHWTKAGSDGAAGSGYDSYYNKSGDWLVLRTGNEATAEHKWHAGSVQTWDPITFSNDATTYARAFIDAWINANKTRMVKLSSQAVANHFNDLETPDSAYTIGPAPGGNAAGHTYLRIKDTASDLDVVIVIANPKLGTPGAMEGCSPSCG